MVAKVDASLLNVFGQVTWQPKSSYFSSTVENAPAELAADLTTQLVVEEQSEHRVEQIFIGSGLDSFWDNEESTEWRLLANIFNAVGFSVENIEYYDTSNLHSEDTVFATLEEIIESGVEIVFSFDERGELVDQLGEGLQVVHLPDLQHQLMSGQAKKNCYQQLLSHV